MVSEDCIIIFLSTASESVSLKFKTLPQDMSGHIITVKVKTAADKAFEASIPFTFKKNQKCRFCYDIIIFETFVCQQFYQ